MKRILLLCAASSALLLVGCSQPSFVIHPANQAKCLGQSVVFSVVVSGDSLTSQWQRLVNGAWFNLHDGDEGTVSGATTLALTISSVVPADATSYRLVISNSSGSATSDSASLIVGGLPPPAGGVCWWQGEGNGADVFALNPGIVSGSGVTFSPGKEGQAFTFNGAGSVRVPASPNLNVGAGGGFTVEAWVKPQSVAAAQPILEWSSAGITGPAIWIAGDGTLSASIRDGALIDPGFYCYLQLTPGVWHHVALTYDPSQSAAFLYLDDNVAGEAWTSPFLLPVLTIGDFYLGYSPANDLGTGTHFSGQIDEVAIYDRALSLDEVFQLYQTADHRCGIAPALITPLANQTANVGNTVALAVVAAGTSLTYQWLFNSVAMSGATRPVLTLSGVQAEQGGTYSVRVANAWGSVSSSAVLTVNPVANGTPGPTIATQPASRTTACAGGPFSLGVTATGSGSLQYQWCKNGININGATASSYTCSHTAAADAGTYRVIVYDSVGQTTSADAILTVHLSPTAMLSLPDGGTVQVERCTRIRTLLTGTGPWTLEWSDGKTETRVEDNPHDRWVCPNTTTTYQLTRLSDQSSNCDAPASGLGGTVTVTVSGGASLEPPISFGGAQGYNVLSGDHTAFTFGANMKFYVEGEVNLYGRTTIEGGTVVLFDPGAKIIIHDPDIICDTGPYRTATFGSWEQLNYFPSLTDPPATAYCGQGLSLDFPSGASVVLKYLQFFNLEAAISFEGAAGCTCTLYDCQFVDCNNALVQTAPSATVKVLNALFCHLTSVFALDTGVTPTVTLQHVTVDDCQSFATGLSGSGAWTGINSLFVGDAAFRTSIPSSVQSSGTCRFPSPTPSIFQSGGDGSHYLKEGTYHALGTTAIDPTLRAELAHKTTHPPIDLPMQFQMGGSITFSPQVERYTDGTSPDLGFYYDAADWTVSDFVVLIGGQVTVLPGTVIAVRYDGVVGFDLQPGTSFTSQGMPTRPITYAPVSMIQEGPFPYLFLPGFLVSFVPDYWPGPDSDVSGWNYNPSGDPPPALNFRFSNFYLSAAISHHFWSGALVPFIEPLDNVVGVSLSSAMFLQLRDCALHGGWLNLGEMNPEMPYIKLVQLGGTPIPGSVCFFNNLFDRVNINLDPDSGSVYWYGPFPNPTIDLRLTATNNTFRGGWLYLEPLRSSAGNWVFENNLFDKTVFAQDRSQPLDYDYNAYWPCVGTWPSPGAELMPDQAAHLDSTTTGDGYTDGAHDLTLIDTAPAYSTGPLGDFYLPTTTPTLQHVGSCSAAAIGLYHYTTDASMNPTTGQAKEGGATQVDIGLHYVAVQTSGANAGQPQDYDHDGIPDYVENWRGDGSRSWPDETDWQTATDPTSTLYDDVDLSGNGLVGRVKKALGLTPFTTANPLSLTQVITGEEPDIATFELPLTYNLATGAGILDLEVNGLSAHLQKPESTAGGSSNCRLVWNTTYEPPGQIFLQARLVLYSETYGASSLLNAGPPLPFVSPNVAQFSESTAIFDENGAILYARLPQNEADYVIRIYDTTNPNPSAPPIKTLTGSTTDGTIQAQWSALVRDDTSALFTGNQFRANYAVSLHDPPASSANNQIVNRSPMQVVDDNKFNLAYMSPPELVSLAQRGGAQWSHLQDVVNTLMQWQNPVLNYSSDFDVYTAAAGKTPYPGYVDTRDKAIQLKNLLAAAKNFYYMGHGTPYMLYDKNGPDNHTPQPSAYLRVDEVAAALGNTIDPRQGLSVGRAYRFVFLNGCGTAAVKLWQHAFGFLDIEDAPQALTDVRGSQAFVGWERGTAGPDQASEWDDKPYGSPEPRKGYGSMLEEFYTAWMNGKTLAGCIGQACDQKKYAWPLPVPANRNIYTKPGDPTEYTAPLRIVGTLKIKRIGSAP